MSSGSFYGSLWGWGDNTFGELGDNTTIKKSSPIQTIAGGTNWKLVSGGYHTAAIKTDGTLWTWGGNNYGQLGNNSITNNRSPVQTISGGSTWWLVGCSKGNTAAIKTDGTLWTWGWNNYGQLGDGTIAHKSSPVQTIAGGTSWKSVACGYYHTAAIKTDGSLWLWGHDTYGQLGDNTTAHKSSPIQTISSGTNWKSVACGYYHTAAIKLDGTLWGWGRNYYGNLGDGTTVYKSSPVQTVAGGTNWKQVSCNSGSHTTAIKTDGTLWTWGNNAYGQLGDGTVILRSSPVQTIVGGTNWAQTSGGYQHTAAIKSDGTLWVWGRDSYGQLGNSAVISQSSPIQTVAGGINWKSVCASAFSHTYAIAESSTPYVTNVAIAGTTSTTMLSSYTYTATMTYNNGTTSTDCSLLNWTSGGGQGLSTISNVTSSNITAYMDDSGADYIIAKTPSGVTGSLSITTSNSISAGLWTCGYNNIGQLGTNNRTITSSPVQTVTGGTWKYVTTGLGESVFGIKTDGTLWGWGAGSSGQLGTNNYINTSSPVQIYGGGTNWKQAASGNLWSGAIKTDGTLWMFGWNNSGRLGDGTTVDKSSPVQTIAGGTNWKQISMGYDHAMAVKTDGTLWGWGRDQYGQLGDNLLGVPSSPIQTASGGTNWRQVACGANCSAAVKTDGTLWVWGRDNYGQLGQNSTLTNKSSPVQTITGGTSWTRVSCGYAHMSAIKSDGTLWSWGHNGSGQLGDGTQTHKSSPVQTTAGGNSWIYVACGANFTAAIKSGGVLWLWGTEGGGGGSLNIAGSWSTSPVQAIMNSGVWKSVSCSRYIVAGLY